MKKTMIRLLKGADVFCAAMVACLLGTGILGAAAVYEQSTVWPGTIRGEFYDVKPSGDYLFISNASENALQVVPANQQELQVAARLDISDASCMGMFIDRDTLYLGESDGIQLIDISNPLEPKLGDKWELSFTYYTTSTNIYTGIISTTTNTVSNVFDLSKKGDTFYLVAGMAGFRTLDMSDPANPKEIGSYDPHGWFPQYLEMSDDFQTAYIGSLFKQLYILDVSDPANPTSLWYNDSFLGNLTITDLARVEDHLYVTDYYSGEFGWGRVAAIDVQTPSSPVMTKDNVFNGYNFYHYFPIRKENTIEGWAFFSTQQSITIGTNVETREHYWANLFQVNESTYDMVPLRSDICMDGETYSVAFKGQYAYVADRDAGCRILDMSNPASPVEVNSIAAKTWLYDVKVDGDRLYLAAGCEGFRIFDITDPVNPVFLGEYVSQLTASDYHVYYGQVKDFVVEGDIAYLGVDIEGIYVHLACTEIINIADPANPKLKYYWGNYGVCNSVQKYEDTLFLVGSGQYITVDVSCLHDATYTDVFYKGHFDIPGNGGDRIVIPENTTPIGYIPAGTNGIAAVDFSDISNIGTEQENLTTNTVVTVGSLELPGFRTGVSVRGNQLLTGSYYDGFSIVDISTPLAPQLVGDYPVVGYTRNAFFSEDSSYIMTASSFVGTYIFEKQVSGPINIEGGGFDLAGDFLLTVSSDENSFVVESSTNASTWATESSAVISGKQVRIPAATLSGKSALYFRIRME